MKSLPLKNIKHLQLEKGFKDWLELTGYAATSVYGMPNYIREFLHYLETNHKPIDNLEPQDINNYFFHLKHRRKQRRAGALSNNYLHKHLQAVKKFSRYLTETGQGYFECDIILPEQKGKTPEILTVQEIKMLYEVAGQGRGTPIGLRDRAMLSVFYGCGIRRNEGVSLDTTDFLNVKNLLYIRKGKNYRERYVPLTPEIKQDILEYLDYGRSEQIKDPREEAFFISTRGTRITSQSLILRLKKLTEKAGITKNVGLHTLRHSIATHLLQSGMKLQNIARLLGHKSLESTQLYTHIINEL